MFYGLSLLSFYFILVCGFCFYCGLLSFIFSKEHLLMVLLSIEFMVLCIYLLMCFWFVDFNLCLYFSLVFIVISVCGGVLGLSILVSLVRSHGSDSFLVFSILVC